MMLKGCHHFARQLGRLQKQFCIRPC